MNVGLLSPSSADGELGAFLDGVLFSPDGKALVAPTNEAAEARPQPIACVARMSGKFGGKSAEALLALATKNPVEGKASKPLEVKKEKPLPRERLVSASDIKPKDIICIRGGGGSSIPANGMFRQLITANKAHFDTLSADEKEKFAESVWLGLKEKNHRFLKPRTRDYELLDHTASVRKVFQAIRDCRTKTESTEAVDVASVSDSFDYTPVAKPPPTKKPKKQGKGGGVLVAGPVVEKSFAETAGAAISEILSRQEISNAMKRVWGDEFEERKTLYEEKLLERYKAAARNGMSVREYSARLLPFLLKEVEAGTEQT